MPDYLRVEGMCDRCDGDLTRDDPEAQFECEECGMVVAEDSVRWSEYVR